MLRHTKKIKVQTRLALALCLALSAVATTRGGQSTPLVTGDARNAVTVQSPSASAPVALALADGR